MCSTYVKKYSKEGDIILDPFGGAGSIILSSIINKRRSIYIDANPYAWLIAYVMINGVHDPAKYMEAVSRILNRDRIYFVVANRNHWITRDTLYKLYCPICKENKEIKHVVWESDNSRALLSCGHLNEYEDIIGFPLKIYPFPRDAKLFYQDGKPFLKKRNYNTVSEFFTNRNLLLLSIILYEIDKIAHKFSNDVTLALYLTFASILFNSSKMARLSGGSWGVPSYWVPNKHVEKNPFYLFHKRAILFYKYFSLLNNIKHKLDYSVSIDIKDVFNNKSTVAITLGNALDMNYLEDRSVDLIFTDPPHTNEVQYFELSYFYWAWLSSSKRLKKLLKKLFGREVILDFNVELTVNPFQDKNFDTYLKMFNSFLKEARRVIKNDGHFLLILHEERKEMLYQMLKLITNHFRIKHVDKKKLAQRNIGYRLPNGRIMEIYILKKK